MNSLTHSGVFLILAPFRVSRIMVFCVPFMLRNMIFRLLLSFTLLFLAIEALGLIYLNKPLRFAILRCFIRWVNLVHLNIRRIRT